MTGEGSFGLRRFRAWPCSDLELVPGPVDDTGEGLAGLEEVQGEETLAGGSTESWFDWMRCRCGGGSRVGEDVRMV